MYLKAKFNQVLNCFF